MKISKTTKLLVLGIAAASLAACGGSSSSKKGSSSSSATVNSSANPSFVFDQTTYVGAIDPSGSDWTGFAIGGTLPTNTEAESLDFDTHADAKTDIPGNGNRSGITPAGSCPASLDTANYTVQDTGSTYTLDGNAYKICRLSGEILVDVTLENDVIWQLSGKVEVGNGNKTLSTSDNAVVNATLTIEAGTVFRSLDGSFLVITRGSDIDAQGTESLPIVMWGSDDDDFEDRGEWGGLVLQGYGYNNLCGAAATYCNLEGEGAAGFFGGYNNADNSGTLKYVVVAEAGNEVIVDNELNGITFQGVGYGTTVDYIQVHQNDDDGIEFFGGAVDVKHFIMTANKDDDVDWDEGYVGNLQYGIIVKTTSSGNSRHAFELDTAGDANESLYQESNPTVANVTAFSLLASGEESAAGDGIHLKKGSEGQFVNSIFAGDFRNAVFIEDDTVATSYADPEDAFINVYADGYQTAAVDAGTSGYTITTVENTTTNASDDYLQFEADLAVDTTNGDVPAAVAATIASQEID